jgi:hypothetical protein
MKHSTLFLLTFILFSCEAPPRQKEASVNNIRGLYIFVLSEPQVNYDVIGQVKNDFASQLGEVTKGKKKAGKILEGIFNTATKNVDFQQLMNNMIDLTQDQYPQAEGIIFDNNLSNARVIVFKGTL